MTKRSPNSRPIAGDFREFLQAELVSRIQNNPKYSLRAFSQQLGIQSGLLSKLLRGERRVTASMVARLGTRLGLDPVRLEYFEGVHAKNQIVKAEKGRASYQQIALDHFQVLSEWYHFAILELSRTKQFKPTPRWIAASLGISAPEAQAAVERLIRLNYLEVKDGAWHLAEPHRTTVGSDLTNSALRKMQHQVLSKGIDALESVAPELRDQSTITMAVDTRKLAKAKVLIRDFRRNLMKFLEQGPNLDSVYNLSISLYPLTKSNSNNLGDVRHAPKQ